jgi:pilus assembly protein CpaF
VRSQVAAAIDVVVQLARLRNGRRVVWEIASVEGTHAGEPIVRPLFRFRPREGPRGSFVAGGSVPSIAAVLRERGQDCDDELFEPLGEDPR